MAVGLFQHPQPGAEVDNPNKTFIGRIEKGFDFLGYYFRPNQLSVG